MNLIERKPPTIDRSITLRPHYESVALGTLAVLFRHKWLITFMAIVGLALGIATILILPSKYTAEALIQLDVAREDQSRVAKAAAAAPTVTMDAGVVVETEARIIRSRAMARRVVERLKLESDPAFASSESKITKLLRLTGLSLSVEDETSSNNLIAIELGRHLAVTNDIRSYLINIAYTSTSPVRSARIANAFAEEYLRNRRLEAAKRDLADLTSALGRRHPAVLQAQARLAEVDSAITNKPSPQLVMPAEPIAVPSSPNLPAIVAFVFLGAVGVAIGIAFLLERRDRGFRSEIEVEAETGKRCFGVIPEVRRSSPANTYACTEAVRLIAAAAGLGLADGPSRVALISSSVPGEGKSVLCRILARSLLASGASRVLIVDVSPQAAALHPSSPTLEDALATVDAEFLFFDRFRNQSIVVLPRASTLASDAITFNPRSFDKLIAQARNLFDVILIEAPPVMMVADVAYVHHVADVTIHLARWSSTPRGAVAASLKRMHDLGVRTDGIVLSRVDYGRKRPSGHAQVRRYFEKHARAPEPTAPKIASRDIPSAEAAHRMSPRVFGGTACA